VAGNLDRNVWSKRGDAGFVVAEVGIKGRKGGPGADDTEVDRNTADLAEIILRGIHQFAAKPGALARRSHTEQAKVATVSAKFNVDASC
jgi:hypothetical protein